METLPVRQTPLPPPRTDRLSREALHTYLDDSWRLNDLLFGSLTSDEHLFAQPDPLRNPLIFYLGHTAAFYVNKLTMAGLMEGSHRPHFDALFAKGVDPHSASELQGTTAWPSAALTQRYRETIRERIHEVIDAQRWEDTEVGWDSPLWALLMALEHDRIHFETSTVLFRQLSLAAVKRPTRWRYGPTHQAPRESKVLKVSAGDLTLGRPAGAMLYGWDNEFGHQHVHVAAFEGTQDLITNARYLEFVRDGGYSRPELWSPKARAWLQGLQRQHPLFWRRDADGAFRYRAMFDEFPLPLAWPAEVCAFEAEAFCNWTGNGWRLPTEGEHARLADGAPQRGGDVVGVEVYNQNLLFGSPTPVGFCDGAISGSGFTDVRGNVWEHLADSYHPFEGFRPHPLYEDFSAPYFDDDHGLIAGAAWASTGTSTSRYYRNWFRRHFYQHAGFRMVRSVS